jgi:uncharacterized RDD family membrane protein YckC
VTDAAVEDPRTASGALTVAHLAASPDRRFHAFVVDRLLAWGLYAVTAWAAYRFLVEPGHPWAGIAAVAVVAVAVGLLTAVVVGAYGVSPGKALVGLRVLDAEHAGPIGFGRALARTALLGAATLPTVGFGAAALAWTAMVDPSGWRRAWHDLRTGSVVVDVRPLPVVEEPEEEGPRQVVNLTAMRLVPASPTPPRRIPSRGSRPPAPPEPRPAPLTPRVTPRQGLGWPLVGDAPGPHAAPARWGVTFDTGERFQVRGLTLVGRRPEPRPGEPVKRLVILPSDDMSLSKTHAQFQVVPDGALVVMDRGSTNGSILVRAGVARRLAGGRPATLRDGDRVRFGDREMSVVRLP